MSSTTPTDGLGDKSVLLILSGWACIASAAGVAGWLERVTAPMIASIVWALTILVLIACWKILSLPHRKKPHVDITSGTCPIRLGRPCGAFKPVKIAEKLENFGAVTV